MNKKSYSRILDLVARDQMAANTDLAPCILARIQKGKSVTMSPRIRVFVTVFLILLVLVIGLVSVPAVRAVIQQWIGYVPGMGLVGEGQIRLLARPVSVTRDGQPAGCVCLKRHDDKTSELKRLYVRPSFRGQNIGQQLVKMLVEEVRQSRYQRIVLDSHISMKKAHAIYQDVGFRLVSAPDDFPENLKPMVVFMECGLSANG